MLGLSQILTHCGGPITGDCLLIHMARKTDTFRSQSQGDGDVTEKRATEAAARSAKICVKDFVSADWVTLPFSPASYVAVDRAGGKVVLAIRGTVSTGDLLTDAVSTSTPFLGGWAHSGMVMRYGRPRGFPKSRHNVYGPSRTVYCPCSSTLSL